MTVSKTLPYTNDGKHTVHIGGKRIAPGETRPVEATQHPDYLKHSAGVLAAAAVVVKDPLLDLLDLSVKELTARIADRDGISSEDLDKLEAAEKAGKTRRTALEAINAERLARAAGNGSGGGSGNGASFVVPENFGELLDADEETVLANIAKLKAATEVETDPVVLTQQEINALEQAEQNGGKREKVLLAILELEATEPSTSGQDSGSES